MSHTAWADRLLIRSARWARPVPAISVTSHAQGTPRAARSFESHPRSPAPEPGSAPSASAIQRLTDPSNRPRTEGESTRLPAVLAVRCADGWRPWMALPSWTLAVVGVLGTWCGLVGWRPPGWGRRCPAGGETARRRVVWVHIEPRLSGALEGSLPRSRLRLRMRWSRGGGTGTSRIAIVISVLGSR
jgi:hypothetical protein